MKDESVIEIVRWLEERLNRTFLMVDHWDADVFAIGVAWPENPIRLAYISTWAGAGERFFLELEDAPPAVSELPYTMIGRHNDLDRLTLLQLVRDHLNH